MLIEILKPYMLYEPGQRFDWEPSTVELLVLRGIVKVIDEPPRNKMVTAPDRKKRKEAVHG